MRIQSGRFKGRRLPTPRGARPVPARLKTSLFGVLLPRIPDARVLDLCAGVGGFGLEALSRGAAHVTFVERDPRAAGAIQAWLEEAGAAAEARVVRSEWTRGARGGPYDLVFLDPPYEAWERDRRVDQGLAAIRSVLAEDGVLVVKRPVRDGPWQRPGFELLRRVEVASTAYEILSPSPLPDANDGDRQGADGDGRS